MNRVRRVLVLYFVSVLSIPALIFWIQFIRTIIKNTKNRIERKKFDAEFDRITARLEEES